MTTNIRAADDWIWTNKFKSPTVRHDWYDGQYAVKHNQIQLGRQCMASRLNVFHYILQEHDFCAYRWRTMEKNEKIISIASTFYLVVYKHDGYWRHDIREKSKIWIFKKLNVEFFFGYGFKVERMVYDANGKIHIIRLTTIDVCVQARLIKRKPIALCTLEYVTSNPYI